MQAALRVYMDLNFPAQELGQCVAQALKSCRELAFCEPFGSEILGVCHVPPATQAEYGEDELEVYLRREQLHAGFHAARPPAHEVRVFSHEVDVCIAVCVRILIAVVAPDCSSSGVRDGRCCVCRCGGLHRTAHRAGGEKTTSYIACGCRNS